MFDQLVERAQCFLFAAAFDHFLGDAVELRPAWIAVRITQIDLPLAGIDRVDAIALPPRRRIADHALDAVGAARQGQAARRQVRRHDADQIVRADDAIEKL